MLFVTREKICMMKAQLELKSVKKRKKKRSLNILCVHYHKHSKGMFMVKGGLNKRLVHYQMMLVSTSQTGVNEDKTEVINATFASIHCHQQWVLEPQELWF